MKFKIKAVLALVMLIFAGVYYYITLPALNVHSADFWMFIIMIVGILPVTYIVRKRLTVEEVKESVTLKIMLGLVFVLVAIYIGGDILSSPIVNANKYQELLTVEDGEFTKDIEELSYEQIPILDKASAEILGNRKMGSMADMVSQFEVDNIYSQINYQGKPVRVSPPNNEDFGQINDLNIRVVRFCSANLRPICDQIRGSYKESEDRS